VKLEVVITSQKVGQEDSTPSFLDMTIWQRRKQCSVVYAFMFFDFFSNI